MRLRKEKAIVTIYDAVSILKGFNVVNGSLTQNYYAESATYVPNRYIIPLVLRPKIDVSDPNNVIENGDKVDELARLEWFYNGDKIISNDDFKIEGANLTIFKNSEEPFELSYRAEWFDTRKKQVITIEDSVVVSCISLAQSDANVTMSLSKPQNWVHNPLKGERIYTINAYVSKDKVHESAVEWYYVDSNKNDVLIDDSCSFYVEGQYTNALKVDSAYMDNVIIKAKNISNDKLKEVYWFFDKHGNPLTYAMPDKTIIEGSNVFSLPESPITSKLDYRIDGLTLTNLVQNGNFSDGMNGWTISGDENSSLDDGVLTLVGDTPVLKKMKKIQPEGDKLYISSEFYLKRDLDVIKVIHNQGGVLRYTGQKGWNKLSEVFESAGQWLSLSFSRNSTDVESFKITNIMVFNLTQTFGAGNEPTKEWCDEHISGYFEGAKSVTVPLRIKSVGENLAKPKEKDFELGGIRCSYLGGNRCRLTGKTGAISASIIMTKPVSLGAGTYYSSCPLWGGKKGNLGEGKIVLNKEATVSLYYWVRGNSDYIDKEFELYLYRQGEAPSIIRPYQETIAYFNDEIELKSVGEVKDYIENGKLYKNLSQTYKLKDLKRYYIASTNNAEYSKLGIHRFDLERLGYYGNAKLNIYIQDLLYSGKNRSYLEEADKDSYFCRDAFYGHHQLAIHTELNKYKNVDELIEDYGDLDIFFQLKEEVINLSTSGSLTTYPNGTIFIEPATLVEQQYNDGLQVDLPVKTLESIKVGADYLDTSKAVVNENLITHPELENGDFVTIEYIYDDSPIYGTNSIGYLSLEDILDDLWLDNVYTYKITNGEWELVKITDIEDYEEWLKTEKTSPYTLAPDGVIFGNYEAETKFIRQYPSSLYVDIIAPTRLKQGITKIKARVLVGTRDGVVENPSNYFHFVWYRKENQAGAVETIIGHGEEIEIDTKEKDMIGVELQSLGVLSDTKTGDDRTLTDDENRKITLR